MWRRSRLCGLVESWREAHRDCLLQPGCVGQGLTALGGPAERKQDTRSHLFVLGRNTLQPHCSFPSSHTRLLAQVFSWTFFLTPSAPHPRLQTPSGA